MKNYIIIKHNLREVNNYSRKFVQNISYNLHQRNSKAPNVVYNSAKLSQYFNVKDPVAQKYKSDLVYKCTCPQIDCNESHIGESERRFEEQIKDHTNVKKSHICKYCSSVNSKHFFSTVIRQKYSILD